ncbi:hypothetical protein LTR15_004818 [Elasticomyces elasticus]|nr:hypothetical protein LTR15_004818 [Elasticomyces elasticus]
MAQPASFSGLPPEIRVEVYSHLFTALTTEFVESLNTQTEYTAGSPPDGWPTLPRGLEIFPGIMRVNPFIREEATSLHQIYLTTLQQGFARRAMEQGEGERKAERLIRSAESMMIIGLKVSTKHHRVTANWHAAEKA